MQIQIPADVMQAALDIHTTIYTGSTGGAPADGVAQAIAYAYQAGRESRQLPPPPPVWDVTMGVDFAFPAVEKIVDGTYRVTTRGVVAGRWHVAQDRGDTGWHAFLIHGGSGGSPYTLAGSTAGDVIAEILTRYSHDAAPDGAVRQWRVESFDTEFPDRGWLAGSAYRSEQEALDSANCDMRDAQLSGDYEGTSRYRIVPVVEVVGAPVPVPYLAPTTHQTWIRTRNGRSTVNVELVTPSLGENEPYPCTEVVLAEIRIDSDCHCGSLTEHAEQILRDNGWLATVSWRDMPNGDLYTFAVRD